ncbi:MFS transporter [Microbacterium aerolatum]|uniref:MFS transporter n=1 Tax=Microbacterium aerolatum TaxID=153731 RepID=A0A511AB15_9MICO|nr:MFS transporter [Microbacterium aerolatum]GGB28786.1 MFS transporter [Microbacterium aerolatum]
MAFASVVAFMGIGLVDPILPAIADSLAATPTETELLFTSYLLVTGLAMLVTSWISSRIGAKATLMIGLALIIVFALASALSGSVDAIIGFRAGWGLGNALFISTALATIVGSASGGSGAAIVLYEAALGLGIAIGPLLGGLLGEVSWRGPFFGVVVLMAIAFIAVLTLLRGPAEKREPVPFSAPFKALGRPALAILAVAALFYNIGFFVLLAFSPFPLGFGAMGIGLTFFGWGVALAITSIWVAPWMMRRMSRTAIILTVLPLLAADLVAAGFVAETAPALVTFIIIGGLLLGVMNTVLTEAVMEATDLPRSVASSAYSAVRFIGGAMAPPIAALLWHAFNSTVPYLFAAASVLIATLTVFLGRKVLARIDDEPADALTEDAEAITVGDAG